MNITEINNLKANANGDFLELVKSLKAIGITKFQTCASTAKSMYFDQAGNTVYDQTDFFNFPIGKLDVETFKQALVQHQQGKTDFPTWLQVTAASGIGYWIVDLSDSTCIYYDLNDNPVYTEKFTIN